MKDCDKVSDLRRQIKEMYGYENASYLVTWVLNNQLKLIYNNQRQMSELHEYEPEKDKLLILYEIPKELKPSLHGHAI